MKIFIASLTAQKQIDNVAVSFVACAAVTSQIDEESAIAFFNGLAERRWPSRNGWTSHNVVVDEITDEFSRTFKH